MFNDINGGGVLWKHFHAGNNKENRPYGMVDLVPDSG
jgi:hypothetical protein